ncbi:MAG: FtsX-like permease family protein [Propionicimonas sp.]
MNTLTAPRQVAGSSARPQPAVPGGRLRRWWSGWRLALRMASRDVRRDRGRSIFIWLMIAVPMTIISATQVVMASDDLSPGEWLDLRLGTAQARLAWSGKDCRPSYGNGQASCADSDDLPAKPIAGWGETLAAKQAAVAQLVGQPVVAMTTSEVRVGKALDSFTELGLDAGGPTAGIVKLTGGRVPAAPGEVLVTPGGLATGLPPGGDFTVTLEDGSTTVRTVVGAATVRLDQYVDLVGLPDQQGSTADFLVTGFGQLTWQDAERLAHYGLETTSRAIFADPPSETSSTGSQSLGYGGIIGGAALLEVALMVGPAFAIDAARQRRSLALAATNGASTAQLRRSALGQAWLLGPTAAVCGLLLGVGVGAVAWPVLSADPNSIYRPFEIPFTYLAVMLALAVATALIAALIPSRGLGKLDLVAALRGSTRSAPARKGAPVLGFLLLAVGVAGTWATGPLNLVSTAVVYAVWMGSTTVAVVGLLLAVPLLLVGLGSAFTRAPLIARMAARQLARQRGRATATVAAVVGATLLLGVTWTLTLSIDADLARQYVPSKPYGQGDIATGNPSADGLAPIETAVRATDPAPHTARWATILNWSDGSADGALPIMALRPGCTPDDIDRSAAESRCNSLGRASSIMTGSIADLTSLFALNAAQVDALRAGRLLVNTERQPGEGGLNELVNGKLRVFYWDYNADSGSKQRIVSVPATAVTAELISRAASPQRQGALVTTEAAAKLGWVPEGWELRVIDPRGPISEQAAARIDAALHDPETTIWVERGYQPTPQWFAQLWLLTGTVGLLAIIAAAVATILGTAELRPFLATFAAVGADPRLSRRLAATQAGLLALVGCVLGMGIGVLTATPLALTYTSGQAKNAPLLVIPWLVSGIVIVGVPLVAAAIAALATPAQPVLGQRST